jgi:hypothetical protein
MLLPNCMCAFNNVSAGLGYSITFQNRYLSMERLNFFKSPCLHYSAGRYDCFAYSYLQIILAFQTKPMKTVFTSFAVLLLAASCRKEPATQTVIEPPPANTENTAGWQKSNPGLGDVINFYFITAAKGFSAGTRGIHRTLDSGKTWMPVDATLKGGRDIFFYNQQHGYAVTRNDFGVTSDGGTTWRFKALPFAQ